MADRAHTDNCIVKGRLNLPGIFKLFGEQVFKHRVESIWEPLLSKGAPPTNLTSGLRQPWSHLTTSFREASTNQQSIDSGLLSSQPGEEGGVLLRRPMLRVNKNLAQASSSCCVHTEYGQKRFCIRTKERKQVLVLRIRGGGIIVKMKKVVLMGECVDRSLWGLWLFRPGCNGRNK